MRRCAVRVARPCTAMSRCASEPASSQGDPFTHLFPALSSLSPDRMKIAAGHLHLVVGDGWPAQSFTWKMAEDYSNNVFSALGQQWQIDLSMRREASVDMSEETMTGATFRIYTLKRLTDGHPIPIRVTATLTDAKGGAKTVTSDFYSPLQDGGGDEVFEVLRFSELDKEFVEETIDVDQLVTLELSLSGRPQVIPELVDKLYQDGEPQR